MSKDSLMEVEGNVTKIIKGGMYEVDVELPNNKHIMVTASLGGKLRINKISVLVGDKVSVAISPYDLNRGIITYRHK